MAVFIQCNENGFENRTNGEMRCYIEGAPQVYTEDQIAAIYENASLTLTQAEANAISGTIITVAVVSWCFRKLLRHTDYI